MALSKAQQEKYGLIPTDASGFDEQRGIVEHKGSYYQVEGFQRQQKDGLDTDLGKVFSTSLIEDSGRAGEVSNFNTINDVQYALDALGGEKEESKLTNNEYVESEKLKQAKERVQAFEKNDYDIFNDGKSNGEDTAQGYLEKYKLDLQEKAAKGELGAVK